VQFGACNWKVAHTYSSGVIDGVGGGSRNADKSDFTHAACMAQEAEGYFYADRITRSASGTTAARFRLMHVALAV